MNTTTLDLFLPPVASWFRATLGEPTAPQHRAWPSIAAGNHTLILAPTGSGKTLASFLACLDHLWRQPQLKRGVRVLYISPLKALNNDIHRNLQVPLEGVAETAKRMNHPLPTLEAAVRTGDTPTSDRQKMLRKPPHILITTPESLHLMLTSKARETLRGVTHVIIDEIHALCTNKRGVFLSLLLERLEAIQRDNRSFVRIGLSATQRPLDEVARYLGGQDATLTPRPVTIVDGGLRKDLDAGIISPVENFGPLPEKTVWPSIYRLLADLIREHNSTLIFANDRRSVERICSFVNELESAGDSEVELVKAHHGSVDLERRQEVEQALKEGRLQAVCATASLEMGIDMGAVDFVCQVASPGNVARALQRIGRAGHIVGHKSKGRFIPRTAADLLEQAVMIREMLAGRVEEIRVPTNCLDILAQQLVACAAMDDCQVADLLRLVRGAYPFRDLTPAAFETTLEMISGRYRFVFTEPDASKPDALKPDASKPDASKPDALKPDAQARDSSANPEGPPLLAQRALETPTRAPEALQPRVSWDRVNNRLVALPGSQSLVLTNGGTIPDTGQYAAYLPNGTRIGELDEEFIYERRVGDTFLLGTNSWRIERIEADRVIVGPAEGAPAMVPFWRGEGVGRSYDLGVAIGAFLRELADRNNEANVLEWLQHEYHMDTNAARSLHHHVTRQLIATGTLPTDRTLYIEASRDQLGDWQVILLSHHGQRIHLALRLAIEARLRKRLGYHPQCLHHDDGIMLRLSDTDEPVMDLLEGITPENVESLIVDELADSALFALRFRHNAARALLMPKGQAGKRAPLWLQRLKGRDLLQVARRHADFPVVVETFRECLQDHLDVPRLRSLLTKIRDGAIRIVTRRAEIPGPFAATLSFAFTAAYLYQQDRVENERKNADTLDRDLLSQLIEPQNQEHLLDPRAVHQVERRLRGLGQPPRRPAEMAEWLRRLGDLIEADLEGPMAGFLATLASENRAQQLTLGAKSHWIATEELELYQRAFGLVPATPQETQAAAGTILSRFLDTHALVSLNDILARYPLEREWAARRLEEWVRTGRAVRVPHNQEQFATPGNLQQVQRGSLGLLRREVITASPAQFVDFVLRWQGAHPDTRRGQAEGLHVALEKLQGLALPSEAWEETILPTRVPGYQPRWLDEWINAGNGVWIGAGGESLDRVAFLARGLLAELGEPPQPESPLSQDAQTLAALLEQKGASFLTDLALISKLAPSATRKALWELARRGKLSNDRYDVVRQGEIDTQTETTTKGRSLRNLKRMMTQRPEGRWSLLSWGKPGIEAMALTQCLLLLQRYGVVSRELALMDSWLAPWRVLYEVLARLELTGEVRRGYFVEGLSGAQFALPEAVTLLQEQHAPSTVAAPMILLRADDPANLYGSGAPLDIALLDGGTRSLLRRSGNWLMLKAGKPVLLAESQGRKLTAMDSASREEVALACGMLRGILDADKTGAMKHKLTVETFNAEVVTKSAGRDALEAAGFVRELQEMTLYGAWR
jgi:ATP-dependent Lhr-like helicase